MSEPIYAPGKQPTGGVLLAVIEIVLGLIVGCGALCLGPIAPFMLSGTKLQLLPVVQPQGPSDPGPEQALGFIILIMIPIGLFLAIDGFRRLFR